MAALLRDAASNLSLKVNGYELLDQNTEKPDESFGQRALSRRRNGSKNMAALFTVHNKRERAKQRQIFLRTYKLSAVDNVGGGKSKKEKLKKVAVKVKRVVVSMVGFMRNIGPFRSSCYCPSSICAVSPAPVRRCC